MYLRLFSKDCSQLGSLTCLQKYNLLLKLYFTSIQYQRCPAYTKSSALFGKRIRDAKHVEYKVKWQGYSSNQNTWEPLKNLRNVQELVDDFENRNKEKLSNTITVNTVAQKPNTFAANLRKKIQEVQDEKSPAKTAQTSQSKSTRLRATNTPVATSNIEKKTASKTYKNNKNGVGRPKKRKEIEASDDEEEVNDTEQEPKIKSPNTPKNGSFEVTSEEGDILEGKLSLLADKIKATVEQKKRGKNFRVVDCYRKGPKRNMFYVVEDENGERQEHGRKFIVEKIPHAALEYYEHLLDSKQEDLQKSSSVVL